MIHEAILVPLIKSKCTPTDPQGHPIVYEAILKLLLNPHLISDDWRLIKKDTPCWTMPSTEGQASYACYIRNQITFPRAIQNERHNLSLKVVSLAGKGGGGGFSM